MWKNPPRGIKPDTTSLEIHGQMLVRQNENAPIFFSSFFLSLVLEIQKEREKACVCE